MRKEQQKEEKEEEYEDGPSKQEAQPLEFHPNSESDSNNDEKKPKIHEPKGININDFLLRYNFDDSYFNHVEVPSEDENDIKARRGEIYRLKNASRHIH